MIGTHEKVHDSYGVFSLFLACVLIHLPILEKVHAVNNFLTHPSNKFYLSDHVRHIDYDEDRIFIIISI